MTSSVQSRMANLGRTFVALIFVVISLHQVTSLGWLAVAHSKDQVWEKTSYCSRNRIKGLNKDQRVICRRNLELMPTVVRAARITMDVCQDLFSERRWNCSSLTQVPQLMPDLTGGSREQAYVYALSAAILSQTVAKACGKGVSTKCGCGEAPPEKAPGDFKWGGCGDDVDFGILFSKWFTDSPWTKPKDSKNRMINIHNSEVGRKMTADSLTTTCKCHGVSGSCSLKTCWMALPEARVLGSNLQKKYFSALEVDLKTNRKTRERRLVSVLPTRKSIAEDELIYCTISPDYCLPDKALGSVGTKGRECKKDQTGPSGCKSMCCGRGFTMESVQMKQRCNCKYHWCCYVKCSTCIKTLEVYRCR